MYSSCSSLNTCWWEKMQCFFTELKKKKNHKMGNSFRWKVNNKRILQNWIAAEVSHWRSWCRIAQNCSPQMSQTYRKWKKIEFLTKLNRSEPKTLILHYPKICSFALTHRYPGLRWKSAVWMKSAEPCWYGPQSSQTYGHRCVWQVQHVH